MLAATQTDVALAFVELGAVALGLAVLARLSGRWSISAIPFYLIAGLAVGEGGVAPLDVSADFIRLAGEIGVLLLLLALGLEYTADELRDGVRSGVFPGLVDALTSFTPGFLTGTLIGWDTRTSLLLGGVCWISSSGVVSKVLIDLDRLGNRETPAVLNLLVIEDLAMAVYLPVMAAVLAGGSALDTSITVAVALAAVVVILFLAVRWGHLLSSLLSGGSDEAVLLSVFGLTLLIGGLAQQLQVSAAIGAFVVGVALSGPVQERAGALIGPLRDLFAATFFLFFSFGVDPAALVDFIAPAAALAAITTASKVFAGGFAARRRGVAPLGRLRAGTVLIARGEFSIVIATLGATAADGAELGALAAAYVLLTAIAGPVITKHADAIARAAPARLRSPTPAPVAPGTAAAPGAAPLRSAAQSPEHPTRQDQ